MNESKTIALIKAFTYRILGSFITFLGSYFFTKKAGISIGIAVFDFISKIIVYYTHERIWVHFLSKRTFKD